MTLSESKIGQHVGASVPTETQMPMLICCARAHGSRISHTHVGVSDICHRQERDPTGTERPRPLVRICHATPGCSLMLTSMKVFFTFRGQQLLDESTATLHHGGPGPETCEAPSDEDAVVKDPLQGKGDASDASSASSSTASGKIADLGDAPGDKHLAVEEVATSSACLQTSASIGRARPARASRRLASTEGVWCCSGKCAHGDVTMK